MSSIFSLAAGGGLPMKRYYSVTPGSYTLAVPQDVTCIFARVQGAGGSGANGNSGNCAGGGSGEYIEQFISVTPGATITVVVGAGGVAKLYGAAGSNGGQSSVASVVASGGGGGPASVSASAGFSFSANQYGASDRLIPAMASLSPGGTPTYFMLGKYVWGAKAGASSSGGAPSRFASGTDARGDAVNCSSAGIGAGGGAHTLGAYYSGAGGPGMVEIIYFSSGTLQ